MRYQVTVSISAQHPANHSTPYDTYADAKKAYDRENGYYVNDGFKRLSKIDDNGNIVTLHETSN